MNKEITIDFLRKNPFIIYGIGSIGYGVYKRIINLDLNFLGIAVSSMEGNEDKDVCFEMKCIEEWTDHRDAIILIATSSKYHNEIEQKCRELGFDNIIRVDSEFVDMIGKPAMKKCLLNHNVDISDKYITLGKGKYINPFLNDIPNSVGFLGQMADYIIPMLFNDYSLVTEGPYELGKVVLNENDVVLDCGANVGSFSVYAASKGCKAYAFEPTPYLGEIIKQHSQANSCRINHIAYAVSNKEGKALFYTDENMCGGNTLFEERMSNGKAYEVNLISIDKFVEKENLTRVDFIKADIEGAERLMLEGATDTLKRFAPKLSLCTYHLPDDKEVLTDLILKANPKYKVEYKWEKLYAYV